MDLQARCGYVREVILLVDGKAAVWARSATLRHAVQGPWRALANLGSRPLAELLFQGRSISRSPLRSHHTARHGPAAIHIRNSLGNHLRPAQSSFSPRWARSSVFGHQGQPLRVYEAFAPWLLNLACMPGR
jgi:chorismate--pyruvate lyase